MRSGSAVEAWSPSHWTTREVPELLLFAEGYLVFPVPLLKDFLSSPFPNEWYPWALLENQLILLWGFTSGPSLLFQWSICLSLCQFHTVLITVALYWVSKLGSLSPPTLFFSKIVLAIWAPLQFHMNSRINSLFLWKKNCWNSGRNCVVSVDCFG